MFDFTVDAEDLTVTTTVNPSSIPPYQSGDNFVSVANVQFGDRKLLLPLTEWHEYPLVLSFCGKVSDTETMCLSYDAPGDSWIATVDTFGQQYVDNIATDFQKQIGNLSDLQTTVKSDLVSAINEVAESGGGSSDYDDLSNKPSIEGVTLSGNKTAAQLGLAKASDIPTVPVQSVNGKTGAVVLNASDVGAGTYSKPSGGIPKTDLASAVQTSLGKADSALQSVPSTYRTAEAQDVIDAGKADKVSEVTISTAGAVTQALDAGKVYHFTGALTALTVTATDPTIGKYQFDFVSGSTAPTLVVPASWVMPDNFLVEPSARYSLSIQNGYCSLEKWSDSHSPFIYLDSTAGDFIMNGSGIASDGKVYANVGTEVVAVNIYGKLKNQLANNTWLKICDISANAKALIGSTYVTGYVAVGGGKITECVFNTWETSSEIKVKNTTGAALAANTNISGTVFILRTL